MKEMKYFTKITLYESYFDINNNLSAKSILSIFQDVASLHANELGVGYRKMIEKNLYWVLSRVKFDIIKKPKINQTVIVETWPHIKGKVDFDRDMRILDENGQILIIATSKWCVIDKVNRLLQRTDNINYNGEYYPYKNYQDRFNKIIIPSEEMIKKFDYKVVFSDLDHNNHMNNTNYANLILNAISNKEFSHFEINYINECKLDDEIVVYTIKQGNGEYVIGMNKDKTSFIGYVNNELEV